MGSDHRGRRGSRARRRTRRRGSACLRAQSAARVAHPRPGGLPRGTAHQRDGQGAAPRTRRRTQRHQGVSMIKNGTRLQSQVCDTQVIVVRSADSLDDLRAGGAPMAPVGAEGTGGDADLKLDADFSGGTLMGKRYVDDGGAEVLVTKAGAGSLSIGTTPLGIKETKPLPATDLAVAPAASA